MSLSRASKVQIVKETDFYGKVIEDSHLRIVVLDQRGNPMGFYVTHTKSFALGGPLRLPIWRYEQGSGGNSQIGLLELNSELSAGRFKVNSAEISGQLSLSECRLANVN